MFHSEKTAEQTMSLFQIATDGAFLLRDSKKLSDEGVHEVILFNSYYILYFLDSEYPMLSEEMSNDYIALLHHFMHNKKFPLKTEEGLQQLINHRPEFYRKVIWSMYQPNNDAFWKLYNMFYDCPLRAEYTFKYVDTGDLVFFMTCMQLMLDKLRNAVKAWVSMN